MKFLKDFIIALLVSPIALIIVLTCLGLITFCAVGPLSLVLESGNCLYLLLYCPLFALYYAVSN